MHMDHQPPPETSYWVSGDVLSVGLGHYSPDVPCDFANFDDHLTFHRCMSTYDDVYQGFDYHSSPLAHYFIFP